MEMEQEATTSVNGKPSAAQRFWAFPITRIFAFLLLLAAMTLAVGLPLNLLLHARHVSFKRDPEIGDLLGEVIEAALALGAFLIMVRWADRRTLASAGLMRRGLIAETGMGFFLGAALFSVTVAATEALGVYHVLRVNPHFQFLVPLVLFLFVAVFEEIVFRGYVFQTLESRWGSGIAVAGSALLFGLAHLANNVPGSTPAQRLAGPVYIALEAGLPMAAAFLLTRRLWLPIGLHWGWNFFESAVYGTADSGMPISPTHTLLFSKMAGPFLLTGGPFGPEAGLPCLLVGTVAGLLLLRVAVQRGQWRPRHRPAAPLSVRHTQEVLP